MIQCPGCGRESAAGSHYCFCGHNLALPPLPPTPLGIGGSLLFLLAAIAVFALAAFIFIAYGWSFRDESESYIDESVAAVSSSWDEGELRKRASEQFDRDLSAPQAKVAVEAWRTKVGRVRRLTPVVVEVGWSWEFGVPRLVGSKFYRVEGEHGTGFLRCYATRVRGEWKLNGFWIRIPAPSESHAP